MVQETLSIQKQTRAAMRVLDALDRWDERLQKHYGQQRGHSRNAYRAHITILVPVNEASQAPSERSERMNGWVRDISQSGLSFIMTGKFTGRHIVVGLGADAENTNWFRVEVVRSREVQDGFWEYGGAFRGRADV